MARFSLSGEAGALAGAAREWFTTHVWHQEGFIQAMGCAASVVFGHFVARALCSRLGGVSRDRPALRDWVEHRLQGLLTPMFVLIALQAVLALSQARGWPATVTELGIKAGEAWFLVQLFASLLLPPGWTRAVTAAVAVFFFMEVFGVLDHVAAYMDTLALTFDNERVSALEIVKACFLLAVMLPLIGRLCALLDASLSRMGGLNTRVRVLTTKLVKAALYAVALVSALDLVGINLQMLTVFSGAVGIGVGFGLQKVVSNLVSGVILLMDNSIKPGDVIELGGMYGKVESMSARFASMVTRDGKAFLIPNDDLIANRVLNWTFTGPDVRIKIPVSVTYSSDLKLAMGLMLEACKGKDRAQASPEPKVLLKGFGADGVDLELRVWVSQPHLGVSSVSSEIQVSIWDLFKAHGVEFPFPQRDVRVAEPVSVILGSAPGRKGEGGEGQG